MCQTSITAASFETDSKPGHGGAIAFVIILIVILLGGCFYKRVEVLHYGTIAYMRLHSCLTTIRPFGRIRTNSHQVRRPHIRPHMYSLYQTILKMHFFSIRAWEVEMDQMEKTICFSGWIQLRMPSFH